MRKPSNSIPFAAIENAAHVVDRKANEPVLAGCAGIKGSAPVLAGCTAPASRQQLMAACIDNVPTPFGKKR